MEVSELAVSLTAACCKVFLFLMTCASRIGMFLMLHIFFLRKSASFGINLHACVHIASSEFKVLDVHDSI